MYFLLLSAEDASDGNAFYISGVPREVQIYKQHAPPICVMECCADRLEENY